MNAETKLNLTASAASLSKPNQGEATKEAGLAGDLLWGVDAIANELSLTRRQTYHQLETGRLPARKQAGKWVASRRGLAAYFSSILTGEVV
jgi:hypothetical protein